MQNRNTKFVIKQDEANMQKDAKMRQMANKTIKEDLWDSHWLMKKYPNRFNADYEKEDLGGDIYDPALFPNRYVDESAN